MKRGLRGLACAALLSGAGIGAAQAQSDYPSHPVRIIVPFAPGGVVDVMARLLSKKLTEETGKAFYLDNVAGAGGNIGSRTAASAPKDGYTLLVTSSSFVVNPSLHAKVPYDPIKDFSPITIAAASPNILVVNPNLPVQSVQALIADMRKSPGKYSFASAGIGTTPHLSGELFKQSVNVDIVHAPFTGAGPALQSTIGGHTPLAFSGLPPAVSMVKSGQLRALAVTSAKRQEALPDVPTMAEQGLQGQEAETLIFVMAPSGTPPAIVEHIGDMLRKILKMPDVTAQFDSLGFSAMGTSSEASAERVRQEIATWAKVIAGANLRQAE